MFSFFKKSRNEVPGWASFFSSKEYVKFIELVEAYFTRKGKEFTIEDGVLYLNESETGFNELGLMNVAQNCKQNKLGDYQGVISNHFDSFERINEFESEFNKTVEDYNSIEKYIGVRLYPKEYAMYLSDDNTIGKDIAGDIYAMLVFDLPESVINIKPDQAEKWNKSFKELFETGLRNIRHNYSIEIEQKEFAGSKIWFVSEDHFFAPNIILDLKSHPELVGKHGSLIGVPHRHTVIIYPINDIEVMKVVNTMMPVIYGMNQEGPGSISNKLFWYKDREFTELPYEITNKEITFSPPETFFEMLEELG